MESAIWSIVNSIASVAESFCEHGYNFMRDGLLGGNYRLHTALAWVAVGMMVVGGVGLSIMKKAFAKKIQMAKVQKWLNKNVKVSRHAETLQAFGPDIAVRKVKKGTVVNRYWGGKSEELGRWVTPSTYADPISSLALDTSMNTAQNMSKLMFTKKTMTLQGTVAPNFGQNGGGFQILVSNKNLLITL